MNPLSNALKVSIGEAVKKCDECEKLREQVRELKAQVASRDRLIQARHYDHINSTREDVVVPAFGKLSPELQGFRKSVIQSPPEILQTGFCFYCDKALSKDDTTLDHFIPKSKGGKGRWCIKVLACFQCNKKKADRLPTDAEWNKLFHRLRGARRERAFNAMLALTTAPK